MRRKRTRPKAKRIKSKVFNERVRKLLRKKRKEFNNTPPGNERDILRHQIRKLTLLYTYPLFMYYDLDSDGEIKKSACNLIKSNWVVWAALYFDMEGISTLERYIWRTLSEDVPIFTVVIMPFVLVLCLFLFPLWSANTLYEKKFYRWVRMNQSEVFRLKNKKAGC